jgi:histidine ammonia-lyase
VKYIVAIEYLSANQALHIVGASAPAIKKAMKALNISKFTKDEIYSSIIEDIKQKMEKDEITKSVETLLKISL